MYYTCMRCRYTFKTESEPDRCPDCGYNEVRTSTEKEKEEYESFRKEFNQVPIEDRSV
ncbi:hypothetical protein MUJ63_03665 [Lachnospiraceae bacterium NSJ-143]|nr:hypothetical protein [Lachnospiraceae bacterium NSJ-143]